MCGTGLLPIRAVPGPGVVIEDVIATAAAEQHDPTPSGVVGQSHTAPRPRRMRRTELLPVRAVPGPRVIEAPAIRGSPEQHHPSACSVVRHRVMTPRRRRVGRTELRPILAVPNPWIGE